MRFRWYRKIRLLPEKFICSEVISEDFFTDLVLIRLFFLIIQKDLR